MRTIQIPARLPEKQDIINSFEDLTNEEIKRFVCDFEELKDIDEFHTKTIHTKRFVDVLQFQKVRIDDSWTEFYSGKTATVYIVSHHEGIAYFEGITFKENRPEQMGYGLDPDIAKAHAYCTKCNTEISMLPTWLGHYSGKCTCQ